MINRSVLSLKKSDIEEPPMQVVSSLGWNATDALMALGLARNIHGTNIGVRNCATRLLGVCNKDVCATVLQPILWAEDPVELLNTVLESHTVTETGKITA